MITQYHHKFVDPSSSALPDDGLVQVELLHGSPIPNPLRDFLRRFQGSVINYAIRIETDDGPWTVPMHTILSVGPDERESTRQPSSIHGFMQFNAQMHGIPTHYIPFGFFLPGIPLLCDTTDCSCPILMFGTDLDTDDDVVTIFSSFNDYVDAWYVDDDSICSRIRLAAENRIDTKNSLPFLEWLDAAVPGWRSRYADACPGIANDQ